MHIFPQRRIFLPAITIIATVCLLLLIIGISTVRNLNRQRANVTNELKLQAEWLLWSIEASARYAVRMQMHEADFVETLINEMAENQRVAYISLFNRNGRVIHHTQKTIIDTFTHWIPSLPSEKNMAYQIIKEGEGSGTFEAAKRFLPMPSGMSDRDFSHIHFDDIILVGLKMSAYDAAIEADIEHAFVMAAILIILGAGAIFFIFVIQNYYLVGKTLEQTKDYARQVISNMANGLLSIDKKGRVTSINPAASALFGIDWQQNRYEDLKSLIDTHVLGVDEFTLKEMHSIEKEILYPVAEGPKLPIGVNISPILGKNKGYSGAVIEIRDLREIKKLEKEVRRVEKLAAIGKLAAGIAHEIRNPLSSIKGFAQFLAHALKDRPKEKEYAQIMAKEIDRINKTVNDLLAFAKPMVPEFEPCDIKELIHHLVLLVSKDAEAGSIHISCSVMVEKKIFLDAGQMTQALLNILINGLNAIEREGKIHIQAELDEGGRELLISVRDSGIGIPLEHIEKIFDPFFTLREEGTGLGLSIVSKIIENHKGTIHVESPCHDGSCGTHFLLTIPVDNPADEKSEQPDSC